MRDSSATFILKLTPSQQVTVTHTRHRHSHVSGGRVALDCKVECFVRNCHTVEWAGSLAPRLGCWYGNLIATVARVRQLHVKMRAYERRAGLVKCCAPNRNVVRRDRCTIMHACTRERTFTRSR